MKNLPKPASSVRKTKDEKLFCGLWIRWSALSTPERLVCANIVLLPVWWVSGFLSYMPLLLLLGIGLYEWRCYGRLRLKHPSLVVIALFAFYAYDFIDLFLLLHRAHPSVELPPGAVNRYTINNLIKSAFEFAIPVLAWYIQSNNIRVRLEVVAWACSVSVVQMLVGWLLVEFTVPQSFEHNPPPTLYSLLTGKGEEYDPNLGSANYLQFFDDQRRVLFFFGNSQPAAAFIGLVSLLALDIKNRLWSLLLLGACIFPLILSETRSVWLALPAMMFLRFFFLSGKFGGAWLVFALVAMLSFGTLSLTPVTNMLLNTYEGTATAVEEYRPGSTAGRASVYEETLEAIPNKLLFGHKILGSSVYTTHGSGEGPEVGSHSFTLGGLLYLRGLIGTGIFVTFWGGAHALVLPYPGWEAVMLLLNPIVF